MKSFFTDDELRCKCCGKIRMATDFVEKLNMARWLAGFPFVVNSGYRCGNHNTAVGSTTSNHVVGAAADIRCGESGKRYEMIKAMIGAGMLGIGIGIVYVHCDDNRQTPRIWTY